MIEVEIPGLRTFHFEHLVFDVNCTIAKDGLLLEGVGELLEQLRTRLKIHLNTHGKPG